MKYSSGSLNCFVKDSFKIESAGHGILDGKTFVLKDCVAVAEHISSFGHANWRATHSESKYTAPFVDKLLANGVSLVGLTKLDQLTYSLIGNVGEEDSPVNPLYKNRFTGGSSSGSASAVAGGLADFGVGTDTAGSIRVPAAACGLYGIRPTHRRIDTTGVIPLAPTFDTIGLLAKDPTVLQNVFTIITKQKETKAIDRILLSLDCLDLATTKIAEVVKETAYKIGEILNLTVQEVRLESLIEQAAADLFMRLQSREIWAEHGKWVSKHGQYLAQDVQTRLKMCEQLSLSSDKEKAVDLASREAYRKKFAEFMHPGTIICMPVIPDLPPHKNATDEALLAFRKGAFRLTSPAGLAGAPEVVLPIKHTVNNKIYGVGLLAALDQDEMLLDVLTKI